MAAKSAGILAYRFQGKDLQVFLVHPGGIFWKNKHDGSWTIPKGEFTDEEPLNAAKREFEEETGAIVHGSFQELIPIRQKGGKIVHAWAIEMDLDPSTMKSNVFEMVWPPKSGKMQTFPEVDAFEWFGIEEARVKIIPAQYALLDQLQEILDMTS